MVATKAHRALRPAMLVGACMLLFAGIVPPAAYAHDPVPSLPDEDTEATVPGQDQAHDATAGADTDTGVAAPTEPVIDHGAHGMTHGGETPDRKSVV